MKLLQGTSYDLCGRAAVTQATKAWAANATPEVVFAFVSTSQVASDVAAALAERFPTSIIVGCTTTGEHLNGTHSRGALVLTAICDSGIRWATTVIEGLTSVTSESAARAVRPLFEALDVRMEDFDASEYFCISLIDGLRGCEEAVTAHLAEALEGVKAVGGSAGDDLAFRETKVIHGGRAFTDALVLLMGHGKDRFDIIKHQHFTTTKRRVAITKVDTAARRVYEMDGLPALFAYANALGMDVSAVTSDVTFLHPITFSCQGEIYVRSIQKVHEDQSITFYCGVEEGMVLEIGGHHDMVERLSSDVDSMTAEKGPFELLLGWNCILRALEADKTGQTVAVGEAWQRAAKASMGFDTYGEQIDGLHINQTLVALGIRGTT